MFYSQKKWRPKLLLLPLSHFIFFLPAVFTETEKSSRRERKKGGKGMNSDEKKQIESSSVGIYTHAGEEAPRGGDCTSHGSTAWEWIAKWRGQRASDPGSNQIGIREGEGECLQQLQTHYGFIVYLFYCLWRKTIIMLPAGSDDAEKYPPLAGRQPLSSPQHLALAGAMNRLHLCLPKVFLDYQRPISVAGIRDAGGSEDKFASFLTGAVSSSQLDVVAILLDQRQVDLDAAWDVLVRGTVLHTAARRGMARMVAVLIEFGAQLEAREQWERWTPLHFASHNGHRETVEVLIENGAQLEAQDQEGCTPLHSASHNGHQEIVEVLLGKGAKLDAQDQDGWTPLHWASVEGRKETVEVLVGKGAQLETQNHLGGTPLHLASLNGHKEIVEVLLEKGAQLDA